MNVSSIAGLEAKESFTIGDFLHEKLQRIYGLDVEDDTSEDVTTSSSTDTSPDDSSSEWGYPTNDTGDTYNVDPATSNFDLKATTSDVLNAINTGSKVVDKLGIKMPGSSGNSGGGVVNTGTVPAKIVKPAPVASNTNTYLMIGAGLALAVGVFYYIKQKR